MPRVLAFDLGKHLGFGLLGVGDPVSGSREILKRWSPLGPSFLILEDMLLSLINQHNPDVLAVALPFVRLGPRASMIDTPQNLVPMFGAFAILNRVAAVKCLRLETIEESDARSIMLGRDLPWKSAAIKAAIIQACRDRGWPCCDDHAGDALCIAAAILERLDPGQAYQTTPLFTTTAPPPRRRRRA